MSLLFSEPNGGIQSIIQDNYHISVVPEFLSHTLSQQEGSTRRENHVLPFSRLFPWIRWWVVHLHNSCFDIETCLRTTCSSKLLLSNQWSFTFCYVARSTKRCSGSPRVYFKDVRGFKSRPRQDHLFTLHMCNRYVCFWALVSLYWTWYFIFHHINLSNIKIVECLSQIFKRVFVMTFSDTENIRFVFAAVKDTILQLNLKEYNLVWCQVCFSRTNLLSCWPSTSYTYYIVEVSFTVLRDWLTLGGHFWSSDGAI